MWMWVLEYWNYVAHRHWLQWTRVDYHNCYFGRWSHCQQLNKALSEIRKKCRTIRTVPLSFFRRVTYVCRNSCTHLGIDFDVLFVQSKLLHILNSGIMFTQVLWLLLLQFVFGSREMLLRLLHNIVCNAPSSSSTWSINVLNGGRKKKRKPIMARIINIIGNPSVIIVNIIIVI